MVATDHAVGEGLRIEPVRGEEDRRWVRRVWLDEWAGEVMVSRGRVYHVDQVTPLIAWDDGRRVGLATYEVVDGDCELTSLNSFEPGRGVGRALLRAVEAAAARAGCRRVWLITTNDNVEALRFYQRAGYRLVAVYPGAVDEARKIKPTIPEIGLHGIPLRDELELEKRLTVER